MHLIQYKVVAVSKFSHHFPDRKFHKFSSAVTPDAIIIALEELGMVAVMRKSFNDREKITIFAGDLSYFVNEQALADFFSQSGFHVLSVKIGKSRAGDSLQYGFVQVPASTASAALDTLNGQKFMGRRIRYVTYCTSHLWFLELIFLIGFHLLELRMSTASANCGFKFTSASLAFR